VQNCADSSDEEGCPSTTQGLTLEAFTGYTATIETPAIGEFVFYDRTYTFDSLGSFEGHSYIKMSNEDKHIRHSHVQMKLRLPQPMAIYVAKLDDSELPWLEADGWTLTHLEGVSYHGTRETRHTDWNVELLVDHHYGPGQVWEKVFPAGAVEMRGNNGGDGSYVMFASALGNAPSAPREAGTTSDGCLTSNFADGENPTTVHTDPDDTAAIRCCSDDGTTCQTQDLPGSVMGQILGVDGAATGHTQACINSITFEEAEATCAEAGRRLCTVAELNSGICCGTGCWHDHRAIWTRN
jgi:hypothetical protein